MWLWLLQTLQTIWGAASSGAGETESPKKPLRDMGKSYYTPFLDSASATRQRTKQGKNDGLGWGPLVQVGGCPPPQGQPGVLSHSFTPRCTFVYESGGVYIRVG